MPIRPQLFLPLACVVGVLAPAARAQFSYIEVDATARVEASAVDSQTFESFFEEDERTRGSVGSIDGTIAATTGANGGIATANAEYDLQAETESIKFIAELSSEAFLGNALTVNATSAAGITAVISTLGRTDVALSGAFILDQPLPTGFAGPAIVDIRCQLLGASASQPTLFVNIQYDLSSFTPGSDNEIRFIDTATLFPDGEYSLILSASLITGIQQGVGAANAELSGRFVARLDYKDLDADGLFDTWEEDGIDFEMDGTPELDLPGEGATVDRKDLFVEMDVQTGSSVEQSEIDQIIAGFNNAPVPNPSGVDGINLHFDLDDTGLPRIEYVGTIDGSGMVRLQMRQQREDYFGTEAERSSPIADALIKAKSLIYRYGVDGGTLTINFDGGSISPGGMAELPGDDFIITLNPNPLPGDKGRTIMHELGHNLGLRHGGGDNVNFKPNYFSVMNYMHVFQRPNWGPRWNGNLPYDYSRSRMPDVDEFNLSESNGIGSDCACTAGRRFVFGNDQPINPQGNDPVFVGLGGPGDAVDWDVDGETTTEGFVLDVNRINQDAEVNIEVHTGHDDWSNLYYKVRGNRNFDFGAIATGESTLDPEVGEITLELNTALNARPAVYLEDNNAPCPADITMDGNLNFFDVAQFIALYNAQDPAADLAAPSGAWNFFDIAEYIALFNAGCP